MSDTLPGDGIDRAVDHTRSAPSPDDTRTYGKRYQGISRLGEGGFGRVLRARDVQLGREVAVKVLRSNLPEHIRSNAKARFIRELNLMMELRHPGIVPIYDGGHLSDGRPWYAMPIVNPRAASEQAEQEPGVTLRRQINNLARVAETVGYAHTRNVVHRDLSRHNIMYGDRGEVFVMDWGLALRIQGSGRAATDRNSTGEIDENDIGTSPILSRSTEPASHSRTIAGTILGKKPYMPPEQWLGTYDRIGPPSDVYALGAMLYEILWREPPNAFDPSSQKATIDWSASLPVDLRVERLTSLVEICRRALRGEPSKRHEDAGQFAASLFAWLDNEERRAQARESFASAKKDRKEAERARTLAREQERRAYEHLEPLRPYDSAEKKKKAWALFDRANKYHIQAEMADARWQQKTRAALLMDPTFPEPDIAMDDFYRQRLVAAERTGDARATAYFRELLRERGGSEDFLAGKGTLTLTTSPAGAKVYYQRYMLKQRRLHLGKKRFLGKTPLVQKPMPMGSYLLSIQLKGHHEVSYPVLIERDEHWDGIRPGSSEPYAVILPVNGELGRNDCYVPAGWTITGGDESALDGLPRQRVWLDGFVMRRHPVTQGEFVRVASQLATEAPAEAAQLAAGRDREAMRAAVKSQLDDDGKWRPHWPVVMVSANQADHYTRLIAKAEGLPWRLPHEFEREKAARGVDGRFFPWGNHAEPSFCLVSESHRVKPRRANITSQRLDVSPYGVAGLAGNVRDFCSTCWSVRGPHIVNHTVNVLARGGTRKKYRSLRGGSWMSPIVYARVAARYVLLPDQVRPTTGFRLVRSYPG